MSALAQFVVASSLRRFLVIVRPDVQLPCGAVVAFPSSGKAVIDILIEDFGNGMGVSYLFSERCTKHYPVVKQSRSFTPTSIVGAVTKTAYGG